MLRNTVCVVCPCQRIREEKKEERRRRELERKRLRDEERRKWREEDRRKRKEAEKLKRGEKGSEKDKDQSKEEQPKIKVHPSDSCCHILSNSKDNTCNLLTPVALSLSS